MAETTIERIHNQQQLLASPSAPTDNVSSSSITPPQSGLMSNLTELTTEQASLLAMMSQHQTSGQSAQQSLSLSISPTSQLIQQQQQQQQQTYEAIIPSILGAAPLGKVQLTKEQMQQLAALDAAHKKLPQPADSERIRTYLQRQPHVTPYYFPIMPPPGHDSLDFLCKLSCENLFFMFYYMEVHTN